MVVQVIVDSAVLVYFTLNLEDGMIADSTYSCSKLVLFCLGDGNLSAPLEEKSNYSVCM